MYIPLHVPADPLEHAHLITARISSHKALPGLKAVLGLDPRPAHESHDEKKKKYPHGHWHCPPAHWAVLLDHQQYTPAPQDSRCGRAMSAWFRRSGSNQRVVRIDRWCYARLCCARACTCCTPSHPQRGRPAPGAGSGGRAYAGSQIAGRGTHSLMVPSSCRYSLRKPGSRMGSPSWYGSSTLLSCCVDFCCSSGAANGMANGTANGTAMPAG